jgi:hypothetical protein
MTKYFVLHLSEEDYRPCGARYEIQVLEAKGRALVSILLDEHGNVIPEAHRTQGGPASSIRVPPPVIAAVCRLQEGRGDYVNGKGESVAPF